MKILLVTSEYGEAGGGLSVACLHFHNILKDSLCHDVVVLSSCDNSIVTAKGGYNPSLYRKISSEYRLKQDCVKYENGEVDIVVAFGGSFNGYYASILAGRLNVPFYLMLRGTDINMAKWDSQESFYLRESAKNAKRIICLSKEMTDNVKMALPSVYSKCIVVPNVIEPVVNSVSFPNLPNKVVVGCSATHINEKKGVANLLYMVSEFKQMTDMPLFFHILGGIDDDLKEEYDKIVKTLNIKNNVIFEGYKTRNECFELEGDWDFYIQGSVCEGFCNAVGESISAGRPIFISNTGYISESLKEDYPQIVFDSFDPYDIASKLLDLISKEDKETYYFGAYSMLYERASKEKVCSLWKSIFEDGIQTPKANIHNGNIKSVVLHEINGDEYDHITTPEKVFYEFVEKIYKNGYGICSFKDYLQKDYEERDRWIVCTFDDGYATLVDKALPCLKSKGFTATVFVNTDLIGKDNSWNWKDTKRRRVVDEDAIIKLHKEGWEIGSHGKTHHNLLQLGEEDLEEEYSESKRILTKLVGNITTFAYPFGFSSPFVRKICGRYYDYSFSLYEGGTELKVDNMQIRRYSIDDIIKILEL